MNEALKFSIMGEDDNLYDVTIERDSNNLGNLQAMCSCKQAAENDICAHRFAILEGDMSKVASNSLGDAQTLREWIKGSDIEVAMQNLSKAKTELLLAHEKVAQCRKMLVRRMLD